MKILKKIVVTTLLLLCPLFFTSSSFAQPLKIMTEKYPPFNYTEDGKLTGLCTNLKNVSDDGLK